ncbi:MAG TPA: carboxypeptidase regulatory-like domain-containing protein [Pyrinomonadaceae bacterium]|nr:carboxypeptidase regulatory-like domain-containing protein [Pyrinomonadaceae bacterium]
MKFIKGCFRRPVLAVCIGLLLFSPSRATAQTGVISVADFGAAGDGVTDDGPAFQSALDALADAGGGTLLVPAGRYFIATPVVKDFSNVNNANVIIQGVPSDTMPAPPAATGNELAASLDLVSEIIPATGAVDSMFTLTNLRRLSVEHLAFTGRETVVSDAFITLYLSDVTHATINHCEFYGISTFGAIPALGGGNVIRALRSDLSIEQTVFLGNAANSGGYAPIVENLEWYGFHISNSIFIDYGLRSFFGKMGLGAPLSWINIGPAAPRTPESSRREVVIRDTFLDEGGWVGITAYPHRWGTPVEPIDLLYISGLKMNVSNLGTAGHQFFDVTNVMIENSHYGWSHNTGAAIDINRTSNHAILDKLTCIDEADRIRTDAQTNRLTVINSVFDGLDSLAQTTSVLETEPDEDPVQYVRDQYLSLLGRQPDPAAHFYWSDLLIRCDGNQKCLDAQHAELHDYLNDKPQVEFSYAGTVLDETGTPLSGAQLKLTGSQFATAITDDAGKFQFSNLPTAGVYSVTVNQRHYTFATSSQTFERPARDVKVVFRGVLNRHSIKGRVGKFDGTGFSGVAVQAGESTVMTDANGGYSFENLPAGKDYVVSVSSFGEFLFGPDHIVIEDLSADRTINFIGRMRPELLNIENSENALVLNSVSFVSAPFSISDYLGFGDDGLNRVMIFAKNLEIITDVRQIAVEAEDPDGNTYPLQVEFMANVPGLNWLKQINVKLAPELNGKCVRLKISAADIESNRNAGVCVAASATSP